MALLTHLHLFDGCTYLHCGYAKNAVSSESSFIKALKYHHTEQAVSLLIPQCVLQEILLLFEITLVELQ